MVICPPLGWLWTTETIAETGSGLVEAWEEEMEVWTAAVLLQTNVEAWLPGFCRVSEEPPAETTLAL